LEVLDDDESLDVSHFFAELPESLIALPNDLRLGLHGTANSVLPSVSYSCESPIVDYLFALNDITLIFRTAF
jgi:hypothetical protein